MFDDNDNVFHLIEQACMNLAEVSHAIRPSDIMSKKDEPIYSRMLWGKWDPQ